MDFGLRGGIMLININNTYTNTSRWHGAVQKVCRIGGSIDFGKVAGHMSINISSKYSITNGWFGALLITEFVVSVDIVMDIAYMG